MPMEWEKEEIVLKQQGGTQASQILLEGDIIAPDSKPDVNEVLCCHGKIKMRDVRVGDDRINLSGDLDLNILYSSDKGEDAVYAMNASLPIEDIIYMDGLEKDMQVKLSTVLEHLDCEVVNDRKLGVKAVIGLKADADRLHKVDAVVPNEGNGMAFLKDKIYMEEVVAEKKDRFTIKEEITLPETAAAVGEILASEFSLADQEIRPMDGKVMIRSNLLMDILYTDDQGTGTVHVWSEKIPFNGYLEAEGITPKSTVDLDLTIGETSVKIVLDDDGEPKILDVDVTILGELSAWEAIEKTVVTDAYAPGMEVEVMRETVTYPVSVGRTKNQFSVKEKITLNSDELPMLQAGKAWGSLMIQDVNAMEDTIQVEGVLSVEILYFCQEDDHAVCMVKKGIPFTQKIEMKGVSPKDGINVKGSVEDIDFQILSDREGELLSSMILEVYASREEKAVLVTDIYLKNTEKPLKPIAGAVIYTVQPGDSLWTIAKRFDTTIARILMVNDIENPDLIYPGQKLLIIKMIH
ncbi:putative cell wall hydrolase LytN precursor [Anaerotignum neopropionicum]|uniref:Putative cell wall hydrolase LytN n=1 Tax=Anaerotignum neopropionicum TaxID=36847 RepID=A0A136WC40_9FIRM|nr:SPOCS domain-containing protein [Anaerotignum neopropionicum]KXL52087.1 putative cell wall hydrolase LytN precursor [Anaerotignum neopropionicum]